MAASRPIATLTISFGLVAIPVKLHSAIATSERLAFHLVRQSDGSRVKERYVAVNDGKTVDRAEMAKGYEFAKDKLVVFSPQELKVLEDASSATLEIVQFVPLDSIDPLYFGASYYVLPDKGGAKPYSLLTTALAEERRCAVGKWTSRGREHVVIIRPLKNGLVLHQLHFKAEVRELKDLGHVAAAVTSDEVKLARALIGQLTAKRFDPGQFVDEHRARVQAQIKKKILGKEIAEQKAPALAPRSNVVNLMDALKASLLSRSPGDTRRKAVKKPAPPRRKSA